MTTTWPEVRLGDLVVEVRPGFASGHDLDEGVFQFRMNNLTPDGHFDLSKRRRVPSDTKKIDSFLLRSGDVLFNATNSPELVGKSAYIGDLDEPAVFSNHFLRIRVNANRLAPRFLSRWLQLQWQRGLFRSRARQWVNQAAYGREALVELQIPLPPIDEQRRIAAVLDQADGLRVKRRTSLALLDSLLDATFREMFAGAWPSVPLAELLTAPLRNGVSPATGGTASSRVLTLSAVTGAAFEERAVKEAKFFADPPSGKRVCSKDLLICRGNGNLALVGKGYFPDRDMPDVAFPDTVIAARVSAEQLDRAFLEHLWGTSQIRRQIESMARTTNGTFKVNQAMLESVEVPYPPLHLQRRFGRTVRSLRSLRQRLKASATSQDALFASLQHRAFAGQL